VRRVMECHARVERCVSTRRNAYRINVKVVAACASVYVRTAGSAEWNCPYRPVYCPQRTPGGPPTARVDEEATARDEGRYANATVLFTATGKYGGGWWGSVHEIRPQPGGVREGEPDSGMKVRREVCGSSIGAPAQTHVSR